MGKYVRETTSLDNRVKQPHPVWRGIGCLVLLIIPVISYALAVLLVGYALQTGFAIPVQLLGYPVMPVWLFKVPGLIGLLNWIQSQPNLYAYLITTLFTLLFVSGVFSVFYAVTYRIIGPSRYTRLDAPPPKIKVKKYRR